MNPNDSIVLARFASGDMGIAEEAEFLACCEAEPELWRSAALAMVEHRQLASTLRQFVDDQRAGPFEKRGLAKDRPKNRRLTRAVVAASLLLAFLGGLPLTYWAGRQHASDVQQVDPGPTADALKTTDSVVVYRVLLPSSPNPGNRGDVTPPMTDIKSRAARLAYIHTRPVFSTEAQRALLEYGLEVKEEPNTYFNEVKGVSTRLVQFSPVNPQD